VDVLNGTFIEEVSELLFSATTTSTKGKTIFEVDNAMEILAENIQKNFNNVPTFLKFMRPSMRQVMIRHLIKHSTNKPTWSKVEDFIQDLLQKNTALTLENTQMVIDRAQTYMCHEVKLHTSTTIVASTSVDSEIEILKAELASLKAGTVTALDVKTGQLTGLLTGIQGWKCPVALSPTCMGLNHSKFSWKETTGLDGHHKWGKEECP
jgi:hypothetical protein